MCIRDSAKDSHMSSGIVQLVNHLSKDLIHRWVVCVCVCEEEGQETEIQDGMCTYMKF